MKKLGYLQESILIEKLAYADANFFKQAGLFDSLGLGSVASSIGDFFKSHIKADAPGGYIGSFLSLMAPAVLFRVHPFLGGLYLIGTQFGFDVQSVFAKIMTALKPKLESGQTITAEEVNSIGKSIIAGEAGMEAEAAPDDLLFPLKKYADMFDDFIKHRDSGQKMNIPVLFPDKNASLLQKIFGNLFSTPRSGKGKWLLGGFIIWIIKTALAGAGLLAGTEAIAHALGHKPIQPHQAPETKPEAGITSLMHSGKDIWIVPLVHGNIMDTLVSWIKEIYHVAEQNVLETIKKLPTFTNMLQIMSKATILQGKYLVMPEQFNSRKQVVDQVIPKDMP